MKLNRFLLLCVLLAALPLAAQTSSLLPYPRFCWSDSHGPLAGGLLYSYSAGTSSPLPTYSDSSLLYANTNPVVLDVLGCAPVWLAAVPYKVTLKNSSGAQMWTVDNVEDAGLVLATTLKTSKLDVPIGDGIVKVTGGVPSIAALVDLTGLGVAPINSPGFTGNPSAPTQPANDISSSLATDSFVNSVVVSRPKVYLTGLLANDVKIYTGTNQLVAGVKAHTFENGFSFADTSYKCAPADTSVAAAAINYTATSTTVVTVHGTGTDNFTIICIGQ